LVEINDSYVVSKVITQTGSQMVWRCGLKGDGGVYSAAASADFSE